MQWLRSSPSGARMVQSGIIDNVSVRRPLAVGSCLYYQCLPNIPHRRSARSVSRVEVMVSKRCRRHARKVDVVYPAFASAFEPSDRTLTAAPGNVTPVRPCGSRSRRTASARMRTDALRPLITGVVTLRPFMSLRPPGLVTTPLRPLLTDSGYDPF